jgi:hypothetical protein
MPLRTPRQQSHTYFKGRADAKEHSCGLVLPATRECVCGGGGMSGVCVCERESLCVHIYVCVCEWYEGMDDSGME